MAAPVPILRLCSWNIHLGLERAPLLRSVATGPAFRGVDVLVIQEASSGADGSDSRAIAQALGSEYQAHQHELDCLRGRSRGMGLVWNPAAFQVRDIDVLPLPAVATADLPPPYRAWLRRLGMHDRTTLVVDGCASGARVRLYSIHLNHMGRLLQEQQLAHVLADAARRPACDLLVLAGDFNTLRVDTRRWRPWFAARASDGWLNATSDVRWTFRSPALPLRQKLDHILVRASGPVSHQAHAPAVRGSDHLPVFVSLRSM
jgi:endonuclease/exonuclease/phosphatase family metal-dependent hydrolase